MAQRPPPEPELQNFSDHSVIVPPHRLKTMIFHTSEPGDIPMDVVERAEMAVAALKGEFAGWMRAECDRLEAASKSLRQVGLSRTTFGMLFHVCHDIKADAATLGYPLATYLATSLCRLLEHAPDPTRIPLVVIDRFVEAIRAVVRENRHDVDEPTGAEVAEKLANLVERFLAAELNDDYAEIATGAGPVPRAPEAPK